MKLETAVQTFLNEYQNPGTRLSYAYSLNPMCAAIGPARPVANIQPIDLTAYAQDLRNDRGYSAATILKHTKAIKRFFNWLVSNELLPISPARVLKQKKLPTYISRDKAMQDEELNRVLDYVKWKHRDYALILFVADTGCRAGGASALRVEDINFENLTAYVTEKGERTRPVAFGEECARAIRQHLTKRKCFTGFVFSHDGEQIIADTVSQIIRRACLKVGVRSLGSHSLRHRKGHQLADNHIAPSIAATALGHSDPVITLKHYYPADWASAEEALRAVMVQPVEQSPKIIKFRSQTGT